MAVQGYGATQSVAERPHGDGNGAGRGGRGRALQGQRRVRFSRLHPGVVGLPQCGGGWSVDSGVELQEWPLRLCRWTALHWASQDGHTETAMALVEAGVDVHCKDNDGYGSRTACWCRSVADSAGADGPSTPGLELQEWPLRLCRWTAMHYASHYGQTETAMALVKAGSDVHSKANDEYGSRGCLLASLGCDSAGADGPSTRGWS